MATLKPDIAQLRLRVVGAAGQKTSLAARTSVDISAALPAFDIAHADRPLALETDFVRRISWVRTWAFGRFIAGNARKAVAAADALGPSVYRCAGRNIIRPP